MTAAAHIYSALIVAVIGFQIAAIAGAPVGHLTQGARCLGRLDAPGRTMAAASAVLLILMALAVRSKVGLWPAWPDWTIWPAVAVQGLSAVANLATPSPPERQLWAPVTLVMLAIALYVAIG